MTINGMSITGATGGGIHVGPNMEAMEEVQIETSGAEASLGTGGVRVNLVPKDGGNIFAGSLFFSGTNEHLQGSNLTQRLKDRDLTAITRVKYLYDVSPTFGGPIKKDKLWFFTSYRQNNTVNSLRTRIETRMKTIRLRGRMSRIVRVQLLQTVRCTRWVLGSLGRQHLEQDRVFV